MAEKIGTNRVGKTYLVEYVKDRGRLSDADAAAAVDAVVDAVVRALRNGDSVVISNFGSLHLARTEPRTARNPQTGEVFQAPARNVVRWRTSPTLKAVLNGEEDRPSLASKVPSRGR